MLQSVPPAMHLTDHTRSALAEHHLHPTELLRTWAGVLGAHLTHLAPLGRRWFPQHQRNPSWQCACEADPDVDRWCNEGGCAGPHR